MHVACRDVSGVSKVLEKRNGRRMGRAHGQLRTVTGQSGQGGQVQRVLARDQVRRPCAQVIFTECAQNLTDHAISQFGLPVGLQLGGG